MINEFPGLEKQFGDVYAKERATLAKHKKEGSRIKDLSEDKKIHTDIRACKSHQDLEKVVTSLDELKKLDNRALALIIEGSSCKDMINTYITYVDRFGIEEVLGDDDGFRPMLEHGAGFIYTTNQFSKISDRSLPAEFGGKPRTTE